MEEEEKERGFCGFLWRRRRRKLFVCGGGGEGERFMICLLSEHVYIPQIFAVDETETGILAPARNRGMYCTVIS